MGATGRAFDSSLLASLWAGPAPTWQWYLLGLALSPCLLRAASTCSSSASPGGTSTRQINWRWRWAPAQASTGVRGVDMQCRRPVCGWAAVGAGAGGVRSTGTAVHAFEWLIRHCVFCGPLRSSVLSGAAATLRRFMKLEADANPLSPVAAGHGAVGDSPLSTHPAAVNRLRRLGELYGAA